MQWPLNGHSMVYQIRNTLLNGCIALGLKQICYPVNMEGSANTGADRGIRLVSNALVNSWINFHRLYYSEYSKPSLLHSNIIDYNAY